MTSIKKENDLSSKVKTTYQISQMFKTTVDNGEYLIEYDKQKWVKLEDVTEWLMRKREFYWEHRIQHDGYTKIRCIDDLLKELLK